MYETSYIAERSDVSVAAKLDLEHSFIGAVTVGERGQVVIPADARKELDIHTGDRLLVMGHPNREGLVLLKVEAVREFLTHLAAGLSMAEEEPVSAERPESPARESVSEGEVEK
jgi:AbrB family looped-hinge helix DNA binding protein